MIRSKAKKIQNVLKMPLVIDGVEYGYVMIDMWKSAAAVYIDTNDINMYRRIVAAFECDGLSGFTTTIKRV